MKFGTMIMRKAENFKVGDTVVFSNPKFNYTIEDVYTSVQGKICHRFNDNTGLACYFLRRFFMRPSKDRTFLDIALTLAKRGTCIRKQVGCVLVDELGQILSTGYNGVARGLPHCNETYDQIDAVGRTLTFANNKCAGAAYDSGQGLEICEAIHAEENALMQCADVQKIHTVYITVSPCRHCMKKITNTSAKRVVFLSTYSQDAKDLADKAGISWELFSD